MDRDARNSYVNTIDAGSDRSSDGRGDIVPVEGEGAGRAAPAVTAAALADCGPAHGPGSGFERRPGVPHRGRA
ncbi:hypothetical protein ACFU6R_24295, partial [Streptomyces sp. NPDC057499]|uniref:hypothetical protein n=1 Tax=Streptomyces sp. NPDC057499 TaxID=3346150 RepID=UPI0036A14C14